MCVAVDADISTVCIQCGKSAGKSPVVLIDGQLHRIHLGLCNAKFYLEHPDRRRETLAADGWPISDVEFVTFLEQFVEAHK